MGSSNSSLAKKSCACAYTAFLAGIFSWYADSTSTDTTNTSNGATTITTTRPTTTTTTTQEPGSSVSMVSGYGLDDRGSIPGRDKGYFL
jgi:hypothetical protein